MLGWAVTFLIIALLAALLVFVGIAGVAIEAAKIVFFVAIVLFAISLVAGLVRGRTVPESESRRTWQGSVQRRRTDAPCASVPRHPGRTSTAVTSLANAARRRSQPDTGHVAVTFPTDPGRPPWP